MGNRGGLYDNANTLEDDVEEEGIEDDIQQSGSDDHNIRNYFTNQFFNHFAMNHLSDDDDFEENDEIFGLQTLQSPNMINTVNEGIHLQSLLSLPFESVQLVFENDVFKIQFCFSSMVNCDAKLFVGDNEVFFGEYLDGFNQIVTTNEINLNSLQNNVNISLDEEEDSKIPVTILLKSNQESNNVIGQLTTFATIQKLETSFMIKVENQIASVGSKRYVIYDIYGTDKGEIEDCVVCLSEVRNTIILPCRHLCVCHNCAEVLKYQSNSCPICRSESRAFIKTKISSSTKKEDEKEENSKNHVPLEV